MFTEVSKVGGNSVAVNCRYRYECYYQRQSNEELAS